MTAFWPITRKPKICQVWDWWWNINNIIFHFRSFQRKTNDKMFQKNPILGPFWALFAQIWAKMNFPEKRALSAFKYSNYLLSCQKSGKTDELFLRKIPNWRTDRQTDWLRDGQTYNGDFTGPYLGRGSKICQILI